MDAPADARAFRVRGRALVGGAVAARAMDPEAWSAQMGGASEAFRNALAEADAEAWYPFELLFELLGITDRACGDEQSALRAMARETLLRDASRSMKPLVPVMSPTWASRHLQRIWREYGSCGSIEFESGTMHGARVRVSFAGEALPPGGHVWCWMAGALEAILRIAGAEGVRVRHEPGADPSERRYDLRWL